MYLLLPWIALGLLACAIALWKVVPGSHKRLRPALGFLCLWLIVWAGNSAASSWLHSNLIAARQIAVALVLLASVQVTAGALFDFVVERIRVPRFAAEAVVVACYIGIVFNLFYGLGVNVTGIFATSAVAAAVVGLALQDMLGNIASGIALEFESDIRAGDFITVGESSGWVRHVRLRHTAIETPDGNTIMLPNSLLTRSSVTVGSGSHRRLIPFTMPYGVNPQELIDAATFALRSSPIPDVAADPAPSCIIRELAPGHIQYAAVVWISRPGDDSKPISAVLNRLCFGLQRAGVPVTEITNLVEMKAGSNAADAAASPLDVLRRTLIFRQLDEEGLLELSAGLRHLSFGPGELIVRQGDSGDSMYIVASGQVAITYEGKDRSETQVAVISPGDFFGEASLLTGELRNASAIAVSRVDCYRLEKSDLQEILGDRIDLAEDMSVVLAHRLTELDISREKLDLESARLREAESQTQLLARIRRFFGLKSSSATA